MTISITGGPHPQNIIHYTSVEDATPIDPGSNAGGYGQISWELESWPLARRLLNTDIALADNERGRSSGVVRNVSGGLSRATVTADSEVGKLHVVRSVQPYSGSLSGLFQYYLDLAGIYSELDFQAQDRTVHVPGFYGIVWDHVKYVTSAFQVELALVGDNVVVRELRTLEAEIDFLTDISYEVQTQTSAIAVAVNYYNNHKITKGEVYPIPGEEPSIQSVEAGETVEWDIELHASLSHVYQPVCSINVGPGNRSGSDGVYTVVGNDNLPIQPKQWTDNGGKLEVILHADTSVVTVKVTGADIPHLSPFRIAESAGGHDYNSLHITGDGVAWKEQTLLLYTGADPLQTSEELGTTVSNPYISTPSQAMFTGQHTAASLSGAAIRIRGSATTINRITNDRGQVVATLGDVDFVHSQEGISTGPQFNTKYAGQSLQDFDDNWRDMFLDEFQNQVFGNVAGARIKIDDAYYRITSATITPSQIDFEAEMDTTIADFNEVWDNISTEEFNRVYDGASLGDFSMAPLWRGDAIVKGAGYGELPYGEGPYGGIE